MTSPMRRLYQSSNTGSGRARVGRSTHDLLYNNSHHSTTHGRSRAQDEDSEEMMMMDSGERVIRRSSLGSMEDIRVMELHAAAVSRTNVSRHRSFRRQQQETYLEQRSSSAAVRGSHHHHYSSYLQRSELQRDMSNTTSGSSNKSRQSLSAFFASSSRPIPTSADADVSSSCTSSTAFQQRRKELEEKRQRLESQIYQLDRQRSKRQEKLKLNTSSTAGPTTRSTSQVTVSTTTSTATSSSATTSSFCLDCLAREKQFEDQRHELQQLRLQVMKLKGIPLQVMVAQDDDDDDGVAHSAASNHNIEHANDESELTNHQYAVDHGVEMAMSTDGDELLLHDGQDGMVVDMEYELVLDHDATDIVRRSGLYTGPVVMVQLFDHDDDDYDQGNDDQICEENKDNDDDDGDLLGVSDHPAALRKWSKTRAKKQQRPRRRGPRRRKKLVPHGRNGTFTMDNGHVYTGQFRYGQMHGDSANNTYSWGQESDDIYTGSFWHNLRHGHGRHVSEGAYVYEGQYLYDVPHGVGFQTLHPDTNKVIHDGLWEHGKPRKPKSKSHKSSGGSHSGDEGIGLDTSENSGCGSKSRKNKSSKKSSSRRHKLRRDASKVSVGNDPVPSMNARSRRSSESSTEKKNGAPLLPPTTEEAAAAPTTNTTEEKGREQKRSSRSLSPYAMRSSQLGIHPSRRASLSNTTSAPISRRRASHDTGGHVATSVATTTATTGVENVTMTTYAQPSTETRQNDHDAEEIRERLQENTLLSESDH